MDKGHEGGSQGPQVAGIGGVGQDYPEGSKDTRGADPGPLDLVLAGPMGGLGPASPAGRVNPAQLYHDAKGQGSRPSIRASLGRIAGWLLGLGRHATWEETCALPWWEIRARHVERISALLAEEKAAAATTNQCLSFLRAVLKVCWRNELMTTDVYMRTVEVKWAAEDEVSAGRDLTKEEVQNLLSACYTWPPAEAMRRAAYIAAMYAGGLRRAEVAGGVLAVNPTEGTLEVRTKRGGRKRKLIPVEWRMYLPERWPPPVTPATIGNVVEAVRTRAGVAPFGPHDLRRSFGTHLLAAGVDLSTVQRLMGHQNPKTTTRYDKRGETALRKAVETLGSGADAAHPDQLRLCPQCRLQWQLSEREVELDRCDTKRRAVAFSMALRVAKRHGLPATLTEKEWITARLAFSSACAYCGVAEGRVIEHTIPIKRGGGTTAQNCVPACVRCNVLKGTRTHEELRGDPNFPPDRLDAIAAFLARS
jgi:site-specific recombinase XerD/5-methylcytosine-specific restriction endonuclease McrA